MRGRKEKEEEDAVARMERMDLRLMGDRYIGPWGMSHQSRGVRKKVLGRDEAGVQVPSLPVPFPSLPKGSAAARGTQVENLYQGEPMSSPEGDQNLDHVVVGSGEKWRLQEDAGPRKAQAAEAWFGVAVLVGGGEWVRQGEQRHRKGRWEGGKRGNRIEKKGEQESRGLGPRPLRQFII